MNSEDRIKEILEKGIIAIGRRELLKYLRGERTTQREMILAACYGCMGYYTDGRGMDCLISVCPLYPLMPYRKDGEKYAIRKPKKPK